MIDQPSVIVMFKFSLQISLHKLPKWRRPMAVSQKVIWKEFYVPASAFLYGLQKEHDSSWTHFPDYSKRPNLLSAQLFRDCDGGEANLQKQTQSLSSMEVSSATLLRGPRWHGVHELLGFPPFVSIFPLQSLTGSICWGPWPPRQVTPVPSPSLPKGLSWARPSWSVTPQQTWRCKLVPRRTRLKYAHLLWCKLTTAIKDSCVAGMLTQI